MRKFFVCSLLSVLPMAAMAAPQTAEDFDALIAAAWPQVELRQDQRQWLAQQSVQALDSCLRSGESAAWCHKNVRDGLREVLGSEPSAASYSVRW